MANPRTTLGEKVWILAAQLKMKVPELASAMKVDRTTPYSWKGKRSVNPSIDSIDLLIAYVASSKNVNIPRAWFFDGLPGDAPLEGSGITFLRDQDLSSHASGSIANAEEVLLPLWRGILAGINGECMFDDSSPESIAIPAFITGGKADGFVVGVASGFSADPRIPPGGHVVIKIDPNPPLNAIVVARSSANGNFIKAFVRENGQGMLASLNPEYGVIKELEGWTLRGYAIAILKKYEGSANIEWDFGRPLRA